MKNTTAKRKTQQKNGIITLKTAPESEKKMGGGEWKMKGILQENKRTNPNIHIKNRKQKVFKEKIFQSHRGFLSFHIRGSSQAPSRTDEKWTHTKAYYHEISEQWIPREDAHKLPEVPQKTQGSERFQNRTKQPTIPRKSKNCTRKATMICGSAVTPTYRILIV